MLELKMQLIHRIIHKPLPINKWEGYFLTLLINVMDENNQVKMTLPALTEMYEGGSRTLSKCRRSLAEKGYIAVITGKKNGSNCYTVNEEAILNEKKAA